MNVKHTLLGLSAAAACSLLAGSALAQGDDPARRDPASATLQADQAQQNQAQQNSQNQQQRDQNRQRGDQRLGQNQDHDSQAEVTQNLAAWLALGNFSEVQLGKFATERAQNEQVKQFAQTAVQDHQRGLEQLRKLAPQIDPSEWESASAQASGARRNPADAATTTGRNASQPSNDPARQREPRSDNASSNQTASGRQGGQGRYDEMSRIGMQAGLNKLQLTREMLSEKRGAEFDKCYIGQQIVAHTCMLGELRAMNNAGSPEFQQFVAQSEKLTEQHLEKAKQIAQSLENSREGNEGQRNQGNRREGREGREGRTGERPEGSVPGERIESSVPGEQRIEGRVRGEQRIEGAGAPIQPEQGRPGSNPAR